MPSIRSLLLVLLSFTHMTLSAADLSELDKPLSDAHVAALAKLALDGIEREYPNKPSHVPRLSHPIRTGVHPDTVLRSGFETDSCLPGLNDKRSLLA